MKNLLIWITLAIFTSGVLAQDAQITQSVDLNKINYHAWFKAVLSEESGYADIGRVWLVKNIKPQYLRNLESFETEEKYDKEDLVQLGGAVFTNQTGTHDIVIVIYDEDGKTELFAVYLTEEDKLTSYQAFFIFFRVNNKWEPLPEKLAEKGPGKELFAYFYKMTGKLLYYTY